MTSKIKVDNINKVSDDSNIINKCGSAVNVGASGNTVTVTGNDIRSDNYKAADGGVIVSQSGTNITIGASGDTVSLASGASQSGFGRSGSVNWQTGSLKTSTFTAANGEGYFINSGSAITMNLPAGSAGAIVAVSDYARNFSTYNLTIAANGSEKIGGDANDATLGVDGQAATFVYVDATKGWVNVQNAEDTETGVPPAYIAASASGCTGPGSGCIVCTNYKIHTFNGPGTLTVTAGAGPIGIADYLVLAGGGGGTWDRGEGGGAGGYRESSGVPSGGYTASPLGAGVAAIPLTVGAYPITVGGGGIAGTNCATYYGGRGNNSILSTIISTGGGGGGGTPTNGPGGSGGGAHGGGTSFGTGNTPPVSPSQGFPGGPGLNGNPANAGGGGGATAAGTGNNPGGGNGGAGATSNITNSPVVRGGGGGGSRAWCGNGNGGSGSGGPGGGGGAGGPGGSGTNGTANLGGGGGGAGNNPIPTGINGGTGGSGVVVVRYRFQ